MPDVYCHLAMSDLENSVRKMNGLEEKAEEQVKPVCKKCGAVLDLGGSICSRCGFPQNTEGAMKRIEYDEYRMRLANALLKKAEQNPEIVDALLADSKEAPNHTKRFFPAN